MKLCNISKEISEILDLVERDEEIPKDKPGFLIIRAHPNGKLSAFLAVNMSPRTYAEAYERVTEHLFTLFPENIAAAIVGAVSLEALSRDNEKENLH